MVTSQHFWPVWCKGRVHTSVQKKCLGKVLAGGRKEVCPKIVTAKNMNRAPAASVMVDTHSHVIRA